MTTLDALIARHGTPAFIKIDVEGFEAEALAGPRRSRSQALSFEFTTIQRDVALACIERCRALGYARFNAALGESQAFVHAEWIDGAAMSRWLSRAAARRQFRRHLCRVSPERAGRRRLAACRRMIAAGFALTLYVFYPGVMTYDARYVYKDIAKGILRRLAVAGDDPAVEADRSDRARLGQHVPAHRDALLAGLRHCWRSRWRGARSGRCGRAAVAGAVAAGLRLRRHHLARHLVCDVPGCWPRVIAFAAGRSQHADCAWPCRPSRLACSPSACCCARMRIVAAPAARRLHRLARRDFPGSVRLFCLVPAMVAFFGLDQLGLLRRAQCHPAAHRAIDHGLRPRRHQPFRQGEPVSRSLGPSPRRNCC